MTTLPLDFYVPAKNAARYLEDCLASIVAQTARPRRVMVIVNVHSTDDTIAIARKFPVEVVPIEEPLGAARNLALARGEGDWLACCDADVVLEPEWLERLWERRDEGAAAVGCHTLEREVGPPDTFRGLLNPRNWGAYPLWDPYVIHTDMIARRQPMLDVGGYRKDWIYYEDYDMWHRLRAAGHALFYEPSARSRHYHIDTPASVLDVRWNYSFNRQAALMKSVEGLAEKIDNAFRMSAVAWNKVLPSDEPMLWQLAAVLPLHHLGRDVAAAGAVLSGPVRPEWPAVLPPPARAIYEQLLPLLQAFHPKVAEHLGAARMPDALIERLGRRLVEAWTRLRGMPGERRRAHGWMAPALETPGLATDVSDTRVPALDAWETQATAMLARHAAGEKVEALTCLELEADPRRTAREFLAGAGLRLIGYRQDRLPWFSHAGLWARELGELVGGAGRRVVAFDSFQGSSLVLSRPGRTA